MSVMVDKLFVFDHFVGFALKGLTMSSQSERIVCYTYEIVSYIMALYNYIICII